MAIESLKNKKGRISEIIRILKFNYPDAKCSLDYQSPFQLLVATILSAQCTDERVNKVTEKLFTKYGSGKEDSGSVGSQVALFTKRIDHLTKHLKENRKDFGTQRSLQIMVGKRRKLLDYLKKKDVVSYRELVKKLKLRR